MCPTLYFRNIAHGKPFHAVLIHLLKGNNEYSQEHRHDFWEISYSLSSQGINSVNGVDYSTSKGSLSLIRPQDAHAVSSQGDWKFINVAFPAEVFRAWCEISGLEQELEKWSKGEELLCQELSPHAQPAFESTFRRMASLCGMAQSSEKLRLQTAPNLALELGRFWNEVIPLYLRSQTTETAPSWFTETLGKMQEDENLRGGYERMKDLSHVAPAHLSRVCRIATGQTPSQWVAETRLQKAASLLLSSARSIDEISDLCGFSNKAYFYRLFGQRFGVPPRIFRLQAQMVVPR